MGHGQQSELLLRRERLQVRSAQLRLSLVDQVRPLAVPLDWLERLRNGWQWVRTHPQVPLAVVLAVVIVRPARALRWAGRLWWAWGLLRRFGRMQATSRP